VGGIAIAAEPNRSSAWAVLGLIASLTWLLPAGVLVLLRDIAVAVRKRP
jgi:hypothetical protein